MFSKSAQISRDELGQRKARGRNLDAGFTLIETLIASGVLGIVILTLFGAFFYGFSTIRASQEGVRANQLLVERLETLRLYDWSKVTSGSYVATNFAAHLL